jgi:hypothetical protein
MRFIAAAVAAAFLLVPATVPSQAGGALSLTAQDVDVSAAKKKAKKTAKKKEKVEYMRAVPTR